ncbi:MAG: Permease of the drug/metabolite transporter superfamily [Frankiales bacterium]|nr:Permease of the drug/metabolite transporter superfamily [Frankiales bacterium]
MSRPLLTTLSPRLTGTLLALTSAASFGVMPVLTKVVYDDGTGVPGLLSIRFSLAALLLLLLARLRHEALPRGRQLLTMFLLGAIGYGVESLCYFAALTTISAGLSALLLYLYPALVVVLTAVLTRRRPSTKATTCVVVASAGTALTIGPLQGGHSTGVLLGLASALAYCVYIVVSSRQVRGTGPFATSGVVMGGAAVVYDVGAVVTHAVVPHRTSAWLALLTVALVGTVVAVSTFFAALERLGPADTAVISTFEPVVSVVVAALTLGEVLSTRQLVGGLLVLAAVAVLARAPAYVVPLDAP